MKTQPFLPVFCYNKVKRYILYAEKEIHMAKQKNARFVEVYSQKGQGKTKILVDMATGVNYMFVWEDNGFSAAGGLTPLLNPDGTPVVTPPETFLPN